MSIKTVIEAFSRFADSKTGVQLGAGIVVVVLFVGLVLIVWAGGWSASRQEQQLNYLGSALILCGILYGIIVVALWRMQVSASGKLGNLSIGAAGEVVRETAKTEVTREIAKPKDGENGQTS